MKRESSSSTRSSRYSCCYRRFAAAAYGGGCFVFATANAADRRRHQKRFFQYVLVGSLYAICTMYVSMRPTTDYSPSNYYDYGHHHLTDQQLQHGSLLKSFFLERNDDAPHQKQNHNRTTTTSTTDTSASAAARAQTTAAATNSARRLPRKNTITKMVYVGEYGLGHRLSKLSAAYHLAKEVFQMDVFQHDWGTCYDVVVDVVDNVDNNNNAPPPPTTSLMNTTVATAKQKKKKKKKDVDIFTYLFGDKQWDISTSSSSSSMQQLQQREEREVPESQITTRTIYVRNDVHGYYAGQSYKNAKIPTPYPINDEESFYRTWRRKMNVTDVELFQKLRSKFLYGEEIDAFVNTYLHHRSLVVGLHLRLGNGEQDHFVKAQRGIVDPDTFVENLIQLVCQQLIPISTAHVGKSSLLQLPIIFLATDTAKFVPIIQNLTRTKCNGVETVVFEHESKLKYGDGVSYTISEGSKCLQGWKSSWIDMSVLSKSDIVVASSRSTFTQILPRSIVFETKQQRIMEQREQQQRLQAGGTQEKPSAVVVRWPYCEVSSTGDTMTCFEDNDSWLFRHRPNRTRTFSILEGGGGGGAAAAPKQVTHKVMVHLPDIFDPPLRHLQNVMGFVQQKQQEEDQERRDGDVDSKNNNNNNVFVYGKRIDPKYRNMEYTFQEEWTWR